MNNVLRPAQRFKRFRSKQAVSIGNDADLDWIAQLWAF
jgi:hypothetical protein